MFKCKFTVIFVSFQLILNFLDRSSKTTSNMYHKNPSSACRFLHADTQTDGRMNRQTWRSYNPFSRTFVRY